MKKMLPRMLVVLLSIALITVFTTTWSSLVYQESGAAGIERHFVQTGPHAGQWDPDGVTNPRVLRKKRWSWLPGSWYRVTEPVCFECSNGQHTEHRDFVWINTPGRPITFPCSCADPRCR